MGRPFPPGKSMGGASWRCLSSAKDFDDNSFHCAITSPPYYSQRDYKVNGQIGLEKTIDEYITAVADHMDQLKRVIRNDGTLFLNLGDTYYSAKGQPKGSDRKNSSRRFGLRAVDASGLGVPRKTAIGIPWRVALEMVARGWVLRSPIIWASSRAQCRNQQRKTAHGGPMSIFSYFRSHRSTISIAKSLVTTKMSGQFQHDQTAKEGNTLLRSQMVLSRSA